MVDLQAAGGTGYTLQELTEAVEAHKPAVLFLVQVPMKPGAAASTLALWPDLTHHLACL